MLYNVWAKSEIVKNFEYLEINSKMSNQVAIGEIKDKVDYYSAQTLDKQIYSSSKFKNGV